jgi:ubiquinone/menaquinone biosynthesis C-methylase UbiE
MESEREGERLERKTDADLTARLLETVGVAAGMRVLDAGAGTGAVARVAAEYVGKDGRVTCLEQSDSRLATAASLLRAAELTNVECVCGDLHAAPLRDRAFDLVWCRFIFEYLSDPEPVLAELVRLARVGGRVVVGDLDGNGVFHHPLPPILAEGLQRMETLLRGRLDAYAGRKLFHLFRRQGLSDIRVHLWPYHLYAGAAPEQDMENWRQKIAALRPAVIGGFPGYDAFAEAFLDYLRDPDTFTYSVLILVDGVRP